MSDILVDIVNSDLFKTATLVAALNKRPFVPQALGKSGLFQTKGLSNRIAIIEELHQKVGLLPFCDPNGPGTPVDADMRSATPLTAYNVAGETAVYASDIAGVRSFGSPDALETIANKVIERTDSVRSGRIEPTIELLRAGALNGYVYNPAAMAWTTGSVTCVKNDLSSGSVTIPVVDTAAIKLSLFTSFGVTRATPRQFDFTTAGKMSANIKICDSIRDGMVTALGGVGFSGITCWMGQTLFRKMKSYVDFINYIGWTGKGQEAPAITNLGGNMTQDFIDGSPVIRFQGITFREYSYALGYGQTGSPVSYLDTNLGIAVPEGVGPNFTEYYAPANFVDSVNTIGLPIYAKSEIMRFGKGVSLHVESNPLVVCHRPNANIPVVSV